MCQGEASFSYDIQGQYVQIVKSNFFLLSIRAIFHCSYEKLQEKQLPNDRRKQFPNCNYLEKQTLKSRIVLLFKLCKENHRAQSKILDGSFSIGFRFETEIQVIQLQDFVHLHIAIRPQICLTMTLDLLWNCSHIHISSVIFAMSMKLMNVFVSPCSFDNITGIAAYIHNFLFCFKFCYSIVDIIVNHLYLLYFRSRKTNTKCCDKNRKNPQ